MPSIQAILFDFGGTLDNDGIDWFTRIYLRIKKQIDQLDRDLFEACADRAAHKIDRLEDTRNLNLDELVRRLCEHIHTHLNRENPAFSAWRPADIVEDFLLETRSYLHRNTEVLIQLYQHFRLGCISNNWGNTAGWCRQYRFDRFFDTMIDSTLVGAAKPEQAIFQAALDELQLSPSRCAYVGDRYDSDILGAHHAGLIPIWIANGHAHNNTPNPAQNIEPLRIARLTDLLNLDWQNLKP